MSHRTPTPSVIEKIIMWAITLAAVVVVIHALLL